MIVIQVASDFLRRLNTSHRRPASVQATDRIFDYQQPPTSLRTFPLIGHQHPMATYLDYAPTPTGAPESYTSCFERLGFKINASTRLKRDLLVTYLNAHVGDSVYGILRSTNNETASRVMVSEFLVEHGQEFWGTSNREHLAEPDLSRGFCYPRDGIREGSSFVSFF